MNTNLDIFSSRYFIKSDKAMNTFEWEGLFWDLYEWRWWSRIYEYQWMKDVCLAYFENNLDDKKVIDIATGIIHPGMFIFKSAGFSRVVGTDIADFKNFKYRDHIKDGIEYIQDDILSTNISEKFDSLSCISTLEHLSPQDQETTLKNMIKILNDKGCMALTFDMPGFNYKTEIELYFKILKEYGLSYITKDVNDNEIVRTTNSNVTHRKLLKRNLSCYRIFAWR